MAFIATIENMPQMRRSSWSPKNRGGGDGNPKRPQPPILEPPSRLPVAEKCSTKSVHVMKQAVSGPAGYAVAHDRYARFGCRRTTAREVREDKYTVNKPAPRQGIAKPYMPMYRTDVTMGGAGLKEGTYARYVRIRAEKKAS